MEKCDPLVKNIAEEANLDYDYVEMLNYIESIQILKTLTQTVN